MKYLFKLAALMVLLSALLAQSSTLFGQNTEISYQGSLQASGTNFTGTGLFQFALVTSSNANQTATAVAATPVSGFITTISVSEGGSGYTHGTRGGAIFGGGGSGATITATISNGIVIAININPGGNGSGYSSAPTVTIATCRRTLSPCLSLPGAATNQRATRPANSAAQSMFCC